jgi:hypothetical protein
MKTFSDINLIAGTDRINFYFSSSSPCFKSRLNDKSSALALESLF